jgi:carbonic anhydrase
MAATILRADEALRLLQQGNARYSAGGFERPHQDQYRRVRTSQEGQSPFAIVLSCSDSRVPAELIFDQGIGDIFVIRVAGNVMGDFELASVEFAVEEMMPPLLVVMGHSRCGAVSVVMEKGTLPGRLSVLSERILPAVQQARDRNRFLRGDLLIAEAVKTNVWHAIETVLQSGAMIRAKLLTGSMQVVGAYYDIETGVVDWLGSHPSESVLVHA